MKRVLPTHPTDDPSHPIYGALMGPSREKKIAAGRAKMLAHQALNPDHAYLFCEHGTYVGANGVLRLQFCRYCLEEENE